MSLVMERTAASVDVPEIPLGTLPVGSDSVSRARVSGAISSLLGKSRAATQRNWLSAVGRLLVDLRPDIGGQLVSHLETVPLDLESPLERMSMGEIGVVYEALLALSDPRSRKGHGQYFTPDDVASYMGSQAARFPEGRWLDPCCGVGNLSWHLAQSMPDPPEFVANRLTLIDLDVTALKTAQVLIVASFAARGDSSALDRLAGRSRHRDFLGAAPLPEHDFVIVNPPYAATDRIARFRTADARELYAYFLERIATESRGFIAITPASHLGAKKYHSLREVLEERPGGDVLIFDNVPDTCFRGYKYGSTNTSKTNFVRAAITVSSPLDDSWKVSPILRWSARSRRQMWQGAHNFLLPFRKGPAGEWAKVMPGTEAVWELLQESHLRVSDLVSASPTALTLEIASTPRYYISASKRSLDRGSKHILHFRTEADMNRAYILLNSSLPYWWWRCLDGGITLPVRNLLSLPVPSNLKVNKETVAELEHSDCAHLVSKLNAGRLNENIRRPRELVDSIDASLLKGLDYCFEQVYSSDMFATGRSGPVLTD